MRTSLQALARWVLLLAAAATSEGPVAWASEPAAVPNPSTLTGPAAAGTPKPESAASGAEGAAMKPYVVVEPTFRAYLTPGELQWIKLYWDLGIEYGIGGFAPNRSGLSVMTPLREPQHPAKDAFTARVLDGREIVESPADSVGGTLASFPEFGLSGRGGPGFPSQGEYSALRGVVAGAAATRVLLDGVPFNDPFGGWVPWYDAPRVGIARIEVVPGGGATAWGQGSLGGVVQLFTLPPSGALTLKVGSLTEGGPLDPVLTKQVVVGTGQVAAEAGSFGTRETELVAAQPTDDGVLQILGNAYATDGFPRVSPEWRGPIDTSAWNRHASLEARWRQLLGKGIVLTATVRDGGETHGGGTPYQQGSSSERFASLAVASHPSDGFTWNAVAYAQDGASAGTFSSVNASRTSETPVMNQFANPETSFGGSWSAAWREAGGSSTSVGADYRHVRGESREDFSYVNGSFTRGLAAGGERGDFGAFILRDQGLAYGLRAVFGARLDGWDEAGGHQAQTDLASGGLLGSDHPPTENGMELSPSAGLVWHPAEDLRFHINGQQAFSRPTLGELFQPYGQDSIVTESNPGLGTEHNTSAEAGADYTLHLGANPSGRSPNAYYRPPLLAAGDLTVAATVFSNELRDAVGTLNLAPSAGGYPIFGALPPGYVAQQLISLDRSRAQGATGSVQWSPSAAFSAYASVIFVDAVIDRVGIAPGLAGKQVAGVSRRSASVSARWRVFEGLTLRMSVRALGPRFADDEDTLRLGGAVVADLGAAYSLTKHAELFLAADNLADARIETSRSADAIIYTGSPRLLRGGLRVSW